MVAKIGNQDQNWIEDLFEFYDRVEDANGVQYVERYDGAREDWIDTMKRRSHSGIGFTVKEMAGAFIQILVAILMGK